MTQPPRERGLAQVTPRYLAGGGDPRWVTAPLQKVFRWQITPMPLSPVVRAAPRDLTAELLLSPDPDGPWWTIRGRGDGSWTASFGARTPAEIIAAATNAFAAGPGAEPPTDPAELLEQARWACSPAGNRFTSPDEHVRINRSPSGAWSIAVHVGVTPGPDSTDTEPVWQAHFTAPAPRHVVTAFLADLVSPAPLSRHEEAMNRALRYSVRIQRRRIPAEQAEAALWRHVEHLRPAAAGQELPPPSPQQQGSPLPRRPR